MDNRKLIFKEERLGVSCFNCGSDSWLDLPSPLPNGSVTTSGVYVDQPLAKTQCAVCGLVQRTRSTFLGLTDFYENSYANYYDRPDTYKFNSIRYKDLASWVASNCKDVAPASILEVGCGRGWTLEALKEVFPQAILEGIEPAKDNAQIAKERGHTVLVAKLRADNVLGKTFDLVFSNHVLQHTTDPVEFLIGCKNLVSDNGLVIHTIQDASIPSNELMFSDQNFSFLPYHLFSFAEKAGLYPIAWVKAPSVDSLMFSQMIICAKFPPKAEVGGKKKDEAALMWGLEKQHHLYLKRREYVQAWSKMDEFLCWKTEKSKHIYNFGTGMFAFQISRYCPNYWAKVEACLMDGYSGKFIEKPVLAFDQATFGEGDSVILGVRPLVQRSLAQRFQEKLCDVICWDNFIEG